MDVKQFLINVQDIYQLIKKTKSLVIIGFLIISLISNPLYTTQKNNQKMKKMIKSVDRDHKRVYNIIINKK